MRMPILATALESVSVASGVCPVPTIKARNVSGLVCFELRSQCVPIPEAEVELVDKSGRLANKAHTDASGEFRIEAPTVGDFTFRVSAIGFHAAEGRLVVKNAVIFDKRLRVALGSDAVLPCGGSRILVSPK
jgi:hypothetical protein